MARTLIYLTSEDYAELQKQQIDGKDAITYLKSVPFGTVHVVADDEQGAQDGLAAQAVAGGKAIVYIPKPAYDKMWDHIMPQLTNYTGIHGTCIELGSIIPVNPTLITWINHHAPICLLPKIRIRGMHPRKGAVGTTINLSGDGADSGEALKADFDTTTDIATMSADARGAWGVSFAVPAEATPGDKTIKIRDADSAVVTEATFEVTA